MTLATLYFFFLGTFVASFIGLLVARLFTGWNILVGRSRCDVCGAEVPPASLVPIFSYLAQRGRARCCGARLSPLAPISEFALGALYALSYHALGLSWTLIPLLFALALLLALVLYDLAHQILPQRLLWSFVLASAGAAFLRGANVSAFIPTFLAALSIGGFLFLLHILSRARAMGLADAPLSFGLALLVGWPLSLSGFLYAFWIGAGIGIILLAARPSGSRMGVEVPFAPFLAAGFLLAYFTQWNLLSLITAASR